MGDYHTTYKAVEGTTTEWDDLQRKYGNLPPKAPVWKPEKWTSAEEHAAVSKDAVDAAETEQELEDLEVDDDRFLEEYRRQRIEQMREAAARPRFGSYDVIKANEWEQQVTRAGDGVWVVLHLFKDHVSQCAILNECLEDLAKRYSNTKFLRIVSTDAIPKYPDAALPTLLVYQDGKKVKDFVGLEVFGGRRVTPEEVAIKLNQIGDICASDGNVEAASRREALKLLEKVAIETLDEESSDFDDS